MILTLQVFLSVPVWFLLIAIFAGLIFSAALYYKESSFGNTKNEKIWKWFMAGARFILITLLVILLFSPFVRTSQAETEDPKIILLHDNSESVNLLTDSLQLANYLNEWDELYQQLSANYDVRVWSLGESTTEGFNKLFDEKATNLSGAFSTLYDRFINQNVGAIVLASDGLYNRGQNPVFQSQRLPAPIMTVALGDTVSGFDLQVENVRFNRIVYSGDMFNVLVDVIGNNADGRNTVLRLRNLKTNEIIEETQVEFEGDRFIEEYEFVVSSEEAGLMHLELELVPLEGEFTEANNFNEFFVEVLDSRQQIAILSLTPHPDISAFKRLAEKNENYEANVFYLKSDEDIPQLDTFDLLILHQIPGNVRQIPQLTERIAASGTSVMYVLGGQSNLNRFNSVQNILNIENARGYNEATAVVDGSFSLFTLSDNFVNVFRRFPPLKVPFGQYTVRGGAQVLMHQRIGSVDTDYPLLIYGMDRGNRTAVLTGEGFWRWKMYDFLQNGNHEKTEELIHQSIQYLAVREDRRRFRATPQQNIFSELEAVRFSAELFNEAMETVNEPDVEIEIKDEEENVYPFLFSKTSNAYSLNAGLFSAGNYTYTATTRLGANDYTYEGQFVVSPIQLEALHTRADHKLLYQLSEESGGQMFFPGQLNALGETIENLPALRPVIYTRFETLPVINLKWLFFVLISILSLEWFFRKYKGGY
ncbi:MAG: hypothetical protein EA412_11980 [Chitinophagaceae bacterium]|nr:MAG: hypothetical protein EA412_11980 [Chitinophagaceae bacterium]